jgi:LmbE family N-acetylglucosaminyl deacetylase
MFNKPKKVLFLGAHPDDIEIGCLGAIHYFSKVAEVDIIVACGDESRSKEFSDSINLLSKRGIKSSKAICYGFEDGYLYDDRRNFKCKLQALRERNAYDLVFTHFRGDMHQDHRVVAEVTLEVFRDSEILAYEIPKYDGCSFLPSVYLPLSNDDYDLKISHLLNSYPSQHKKIWYSAETFKSKLVMRGVECNAPWAEAFVPVKIFIK